MEYLISFIHLVGAVVALATGAAVLIASKGTRLHRLMGYVFALALLSVNLTAAFMYNLTGTVNFLHFFILVSLCSMTYGMLPVWRRRSADWLSRHLRGMTGAALGVWAAGFAELTVRVLPALIEPRHIVGTAIGVGIVFFFLIGFLIGHFQKNLPKKRLMKNAIVIFVVFTLGISLSGSLSAQEKKPFRVGFQLAQLQGDFGLGVQVDLPLPGAWPVIRLAGANHWLEIPADASTASFQSARLGLASPGWSVAEKIQVYGEGGALLLFPGSSLSNRTVAQGGYGLFGFEFFTGRAGGSSLFLEVGGTAAGTRAGRREGIPPFGAGLWLGAGFRVSVAPRVKTEQ